MAALRDVPIEELIALSEYEQDLGAPRRTPKVAQPRRRSAPRPAPPAPERTIEPAGPALVTEAEIEAADRVFAERGSRGATPAQLQDALAAKGLPARGDVSDVLRLLVEREIIRDAGFRRTTGQGTAPVYVSCR